MRRDRVDQSRANMLKVIRTAIRLKHSIQADNEINDVLPEVQRKFDASVLRGKLPEPLDVKRALGL